MRQIKSRSRFGRIGFKLGALCAGLLLFGPAARNSEAQSCLTAPPGLVSWWTAEGNAVDSLNLNNGLLENGVNFAAGEVGQAFSLNGVNQYVLLPNSPSLNPAGSFTIEAWVYVTAGTQDNVIMGKWGDSGNYSDLRSYTFHVNASQAVAFSISDAANQANGAFQNFGTSNGAVALNTWTHLAAVYDQSTGTRRIYVNGVNITNRTDPPITVLNSVANAAIGAQMSSSMAPVALFGGKLDEVSFYSRALASNEIAAIYNASTAGKCPLPPVIASQPAGQSVLAGTTVAFGVGAGGGAPLTYQWQVNGTNIPAAGNASATTATLVLTNVQTAISGGSYSVLVSNPGGSTNSSNAVLTVTPTGSCYPPSSGLVSWWSADGNALDSAGTNNGVLENGVTFTSGEVGQAFSLNGSSQYVLLSNSPSLNPAGSFTIEGWVYVTAGAQDNVIMGKWGDSGNYSNLRSYIFHVNSSQAVAFSISDAANQLNSGFQNFGTSNNAVALNTWTHVAAAYDQGTGTRTIYVNGVSVTNRTDPPITVLNSMANAALGAALSSSTSPVNLFGGKLDEVSFYSRALSAAEVASVYAAGGSGKCHPTPPVITGQPTNQTVVAGSTVNFGVGLSGTPPFTYQWQLNGTNIPPAVNPTAVLPTLVLTNVQVGQSGGNYSAQVSNSAGSTNSGSALLTVTPLITCLPVPPGLAAWFAADGNANDSLSTNVGALLNGATFAPGKVGQAFSLNGTGAHVRIHDAPNLHFTNAMTWEVWIHPTGYNGAVIDKWDAVPGHNQFSYSMGLVSDGRIATSLYPISGTGFVTLYTTSTITLGQWTHLTATYDGAILKVYVNGALDNSLAYTGGIFPGTDDLGIGGQVGGLASGTVNVPFAGLIDEVSAYNRALTVSEIQAIYTAGSQGKCPLPPLVTGQPVSQSVLVGSTVSFGVGATGSPPLSYQWLLNGMNIPAASNATATNATLVLANVQVGQSGGGYSVLVGNSAGSTNSSSALLTVTPPTSCLAPPAGLVAWFAAEGSANDAVSTNVGALLNGATFAAGEVGQAFSLNGTGAHARIHDAPNLHFTNAMTWEQWVKPASIGGSGGAIVDKWDAVPGRNQFSYGIGLLGDGRISVALYPTNGASFVQLFSASAIAAGQWTHVAATYDGATVKVYLNGVLNNSLAYTGGIFPGTDDLGIGGQVGGLASGNVNVPFAGLIDEVSAYNRALASNEIAAIYFAGSSGKCPLLPMITGQPTNQTVLVGSTASFSVGATGSQPFAYQWKLNGSNIPAASNPTATNATLVLTNVQLAQSGGNYSVQVSNTGGSTNSGNAVLTVTPPVTCSPAPPGLLGFWPGEGSADDLVGGNAGMLLNGAGFAPGEVGQGFSFNGTNQSIRIPYSPGLVRSNYTVEAWIKPNSQVTDPTTGFQDLIFAQGFGNAQLLVRTGTTGVLTAFGYGYGPDVYSVVVSSNEIPIGQFSHVAGAWDGTVLRIYVNGVLQGQLTPGTTPVNTGCDFFIGGFYNPAADGCTYVGQFFDGVIDELSYYGRSLTPAEVQAIYNNGAQGKCHVASPPAITSQPAGQTVPVGTNVTFSVSATGATPLNYQWKLNGTNIPTATNATLTLINVQTGLSGGLYSVLVSNSAGSTNSSNAVLNVVPATSTLQVVSVTASNGIAVVPVNLLARGNENALGFSVNFDTSLLTFTGAALGSGATGALILANTNALPAGKLGLGISLPANATFAAGTRQVVTLSFNVPSVATTMVSAVTFGDSPVVRQISDALANSLPAVYQDGTVTIPFLGYEGDVSPRPNGDKTNSITDWVQVGRFVAGLDSPTNSNEFQRADCAPRSTLGDGLLTASDWVQAGRYALALDPPTLAGGPSGPPSIPTQQPPGAPLTPPGRLSSPATPMVVTSQAAPGSTARTITAASLEVLAGQSCQVSIQLNSQGNETALGFSANYDPTVLTLTGVEQGSGTGGTLFNVNTNQPGVVGLALTLPIGSTFAAAGQELARLDFVVSPTAASPTTISFASQPVVQEVADNNAEALPTTFVAGRLDITPLLVGAPTLTVSANNGSVTISWPATAAGFTLEGTGDPLSTNWTTVTASPATNSGIVSLMLPASGSQQFYRLRHQ